MSWRRRGLINLFWLTWMFSCGYRTVLIIAYSYAAPHPPCAGFLVGLLACARRPRAEPDGPRAARRSFALTVDGYSWQPLMGYFFALVLGSLDRAWTKAMWPKPHQARLWAVGCGRGGGPALPAPRAAGCH